MWTPRFLWMLRRRAGEAVALHPASMHPVDVADDTRTDGQKIEPDAKAAIKNQIDR